MNQEHNIIFKITNSSHKPVNALINLFSNEALLKTHRTNGSFEINLPEGEYELQIIHCDTSNIKFKANRKKTVWVIVKDNCVI